MAVTKETYTAAATWTADTLANTFKDAFIDAGLMTDWYDEFTNTVKNCVLEVVNDASKTHGTVYYWFMFTTTGVFVSTTSGWNTTTNVPTGTQYLDFFATTTNATTNHVSLLALSNTTTCTVTRYTSGINTSVSFFLIRNGTSAVTFMLSSAGFNASAFVDQNKMTFNHLITVSTSSSAVFDGLLRFNQIWHLRRSYLGATMLRDITSVTNYRNVYIIYGYSSIGNVSGAALNNTPTSNAVALPTAFVNTQSGLAADHTPVFTSPTISPYMAALPADFGVAAYYASTVMTTQDTLVVSSGVQEWEMLKVGGSATTTAGTSRIMFLARTV